MSKIKPVLKTALAFFLSSLATIVSFGLILYLLWSTLSHEMFYKINPVLKVISFSIFLGGFILTWITRDKTHLKPAIFGFLFGFFGLLYFVRSLLFGLRFSLFVLRFSPDCYTGNFHIHIHGQAFGSNGFACWWVYFKISAINLIHFLINGHI